MKNADRQNADNAYRQDYIYPRILTGVYIFLLNVNTHTALYRRVLHHAYSLYKCMELSNSTAI